MNPVSLCATALAGLRPIADTSRAPLAYVDPNTGGMIFQVLAIIFAFFSGTMLFFSARIRMAVARFSRRLRHLGKRDADVQE
jgi:hypothetical protein